jgi:catechol 2,3-dioxygenase-like lactoylglutathione lyase family enzyme
MTTPISFGQLYHTGIVVEDFEAAKAEYTELMGVTFGFQGEVEMPVWFPDGPKTVTFRFAYTDQGPHRLELVGEIPGTLWEVPGPGRVHHAGYWCDDVKATSRELSGRGLPLLAKVGVASGDEDASIVFFQAKSGLYIELISSEMKAAMFGEE